MVPSTVTGRSRRYPFEMRRQYLKILLLASFLYWCSGLGGYLHERYEHWHPEQTAADLAPAKNGGKPLQEADDHDECPTCQNLKMMKRVRRTCRSARAFLAER